MKAGSRVSLFVKDYFRFFIAVIITLILIGVFFITKYSSAAGPFWFNNAVNTSPLTLGNYWLNVGHTVPATSLPDLSTDRLTILGGANYVGNPTFNSNGRNSGTVTGDAIFKDTSSNLGTVTGNATFIGDSSENSGTVNGVKTRYYNTDTTTSEDRDFVSDGPWTVVADGATVDVSSATYDGTTTFQTSNGGEFLFFKIETYVTGNTVKIIFNKDPDNTSIPSSSDFVAKKNGETISVSSVSLTSSTTLTLTLSSSISVGDSLSLEYTAGASPIKDSFGNNASNFSRRVFPVVTTGTGAYQIFAMDNKVYVDNKDGGTVSVIDPASYSVTANPTIGNSSFYSFGIGHKLFVNNTGDGTVSVIDTSNDTTTNTITVDAGSIYSLVVGNKLYVSNADAGNISVIDTSTETVSSTITVSGSPTYIAAVGKKIYCSLQSTGKVAVIDYDTDSVLGYVTVGAFPYSITVAGDKVYVANGNSSTISVIDSNTDTVVSTIAVGGNNNNPVFLRAVGDKVYVDNLNSNKVSVIDANTDTLISTINLDFGPYASIYFNGKLYVGSQDASPDRAAIIDTDTDTLEETLHLGNSPSRAGTFNGKIYFGDNGENLVSIIDSNIIESQLPNLINFTTHTGDGTYGGGRTITITANFGRELAFGSTMDIELSTGKILTLSNLTGSTLSGNYEIGSGEQTPDLSVKRIVSASVSDSDGHTKTDYNLPASVGSFVAENSFITRNLGDEKNIEIGGSYDTIDVGGKPYQISGNINGYVYVANQEGGYVSVIRLSDNTVVSTITVGDEPYGLSTATVSGTVYLYVANTGSDNVSVINTSNNTVVATISVDAKPYYVASVGTKVYVTNGASNTVSVIDANSNTVTATIPVGSYPRGIKAHGTDLYVANFGDANYSGGNYISVIDSNTDTVSDTIILPVGSDGPRGVNVLNDKVYVANFRSNNVSVIDTATNTVVNTIPVGMGPRGILGYSGKIYVENFDDGTISVIDTSTNRVVHTIDAGNSPAGISLVGTDIYYTRFQDGLVGMIDTTNYQVKANSTPPPPSQNSTPTVTSSGSRPASTSGSIVSDNKNQPLVDDKPGFIFTHDLLYKMVSADVKELQKYLNTHGYILIETGLGSPGNETEKFGKLTKAAVMKFQKAKGLVTDGIVGPKTRAVLNQKN